MVGVQHRSLRTWLRFEASRRAVRDVILAALAGTAAAAVVFQGGGPGEVPSSGAAGIKLNDRLAFEQEVVPVRDTRIFDTVAMFSRLPAEPVTWSEGPVPTLRALAVQAPVRTVAATVPRLVASADVATVRPVQARPPARPAELARQMPAAMTTGADEVREPIRLVGWSVPGTQYLPTGRDAIATASRIGREASALGSGASNAVQTGASAIGDALSSAGRSVTSSLTID